jgi:L-histidine N-alpha-methyltransferase
VASGALVIHDDGVLTSFGEDQAADVWRGLARRQKELSPKYFYDERGSGLFDQITRLPEYYPTRLERRLLEQHAATWLERHRPRALIELGAGSADKTRILLDAMPREGGWYIPIDISMTYLVEVASRIGAEYPHLEIVCVESDLSRGPVVPPDMPKPAVIAFLGSTIGNFKPRAAVRLLSKVRAAMSHDDRFIMGADLVKDVHVLEAAYNDARGVTAQFNLNVLRVLNRDIGTDFDVRAFEHLAFFNRERSRIEMHLLSKKRQTVTIPGAGRVVFEAGETVRTEISCKYTRESVEALFRRAGLEVESWRTDPAGWYALMVGRICS